MYGGMSPKRHRGLSNNPYSASLDLGVYKRHVQQTKKVQTVRRYVNKEGKLSYVGTTSLKSTQSKPQYIQLPLRQSYRSF